MKKKTHEKQILFLRIWTILNKCEYVISRSSFSYQSFWVSLTRFKISRFVIRTEGVESFSSQNDKLWQPMTVKNWNRLLNPPTNPPTFIFLEFKEKRIINLKTWSYWSWQDEHSSQSVHSQGQVQPQPGQTSFPSLDI